MSKNLFEKMKKVGGTETLQLEEKGIRDIM